MTVFIALLVTGFVVLLANRVLLHPFRKRLAKFRVLVTILGAVMYIVGGLGQIAVNMGSNTLQASAFAGFGVIAALFITLNYFIKRFGLQYKDEDLISTSGIVQGVWKDNKGMVVMDIGGRSFQRVAVSDQDYEEGDKVVIVAVDAKTGTVEVAPSLNSRKIVAKT